MSLSNSECSSGCESGWTMYFNHFSDSPEEEYNMIGEAETTRSKGDYIIKEEEDEDEDNMSMVSDASSAPRHLHEDVISDQTEEKQKNNNCGKRDEQNSHLDDTASSPLSHSSKEKSTLNKSFSFLNSSAKAKRASEKTVAGGGLKGKKW